MNKVKFLLSVFGLILVIPALSLAGGIAKLSSSSVEIGIPPAPLLSSDNIARHRGRGELFLPLADLLGRVASHRITPGDKRPGPGWGVPEGHNIGQAPQPIIIGKRLDRTERGKMEIVTDFLRRIEEHHAQQRKNK